MPKLKTFTLLILLSSSLNRSSQAQSIKSSKKIEANTERVLTLLKYVHSFYYNGEYNRAVYYADRAKTTNRIVYNQNAKFDEIGLCRYWTEDYKGALQDFNKFLNAIDLNSYFGTKGELLLAKIKIHIMFKQYEEAAKYFVLFGGLDKYQEALILCKHSRNKLLYHQLLDSALTDFKRQMYRTTKTQDDSQGYHKQELETFGYKYDIGFVLNYACLFIMSNQPTRALDMMQKRLINPFPYLENSSEDLLNAFANYLANPSAFDKIKIELQSDIEQHKKIPPDMYNINFGVFDEWLPYSTFNKQQQQDLMQLNAMAKK